jgi:hypothetical protein
MTIPSSGFSIETPTLLPHEDPAAYRRLHEEWTTAYPCRDPIERGYIEQALLALIEKRRIERQRAALRADRIRTAELLLERAYEDNVEECLLMFNKNCRHALRCLTRSAGGCRWAIEIWEGLQKKLVEDGTWYGADKIYAIQLMGHSAHIDELYFSEEAYTTWVDCLVTQPHAKQYDIDRILDPPRMPKTFWDRDRKLWPGDPEESRARLHAIVDRELPRLRALEETLRAQYEEPARAQIKEMALAELAREELPLLRAERMHEQSYARAVAAYRKARREPSLSRLPVGTTARELDGTVPILMAWTPSVRSPDS